MLLNIDTALLVKNTIGLFAIVSPFSAIPLFLSFIDSKGLNKVNSNNVAKYAVMTAFLVLAVSSFVGDVVLSFFGISIPSFMVGAGIVLLLMALSMLQAKQENIRQNIDELNEIDAHKVFGVVPLGIPILAGAGSISSVIIWSYNIDLSTSGFVYRLFPIAIVCLLTYLILILSGNIIKYCGKVGINILTRLMGLLLATLAIEIMSKGLIKMFPILNMNIIN